jgi:predicted Zn-dependent protease
VDADPAAEQAAVALAIAQEDEADRVGLTLARRAGWRPAELLRFFESLAADEPAGTFSASHRTAADRLERARALARVPI